MVEAAGAGDGAAAAGEWRADPRGAGGERVRQLLANDPKYMQHMLRIFKSTGWKDSLLYTVDPSKALANGCLDGILSGVNFGTGQCGAGSGGAGRAAAGGSRCSRRSTGRGGSIFGGIRMRRGRWGRS